MAPNNSVVAQTDEHFPALNAEISSRLKLKTAEAPLASSDILKLMKLTEKQLEYKADGREHVFCGPYCSTLYYERYGLLSGDFYQKWLNYAAEGSRDAFILMTHIYAEITLRCIQHNRVDREFVEPLIRPINNLMANRFETLPTQPKTPFAEADLQFLITHLGSILKHNGLDLPYSKYPL